MTFHSTTPPQPATTRYTFDVDDSDGDYVKHFDPEGKVEIWLVGGETPAGKQPHEGRMVFLTLQFPNYPLARAHAEAINGILHTLEQAVRDAQQAASQQIPAADDGHQHVVRFVRCRRAHPFSAWCEICMTELVPDVARWAIDRGLIAATSHADIGARAGTIKAAIEKAVNRQPGLAP